MATDVRRGPRSTPTSWSPISSLSSPRFRVSPSPSWPWLLSPQHLTSPVSSSAQVWRPPAAIMLARRSRPRSTKGSASPISPASSPRIEAVAEAKLPEIVVAPALHAAIAEGARVRPPGSELRFIGRGCAKQAVAGTDPGAFGVAGLQAPGGAARAPGTALPTHAAQADRMIAGASLLLGPAVVLGAGEDDVPAAAHPACATRPAVVAGQHGGHLADTPAAAKPVRAMHIVRATAMVAAGQHAVDRVRSVAGRQQQGCREEGVNERAQYRKPSRCGRRIWSPSRSWSGESRCPRPTTVHTSLGLRDPIHRRRAAILC